MLIFFIIVSFVIINNFQLNNCNETSVDDWKEKTIRKLVNVFMKDGVTLARIMIFLDEEDKECKSKTSSYWLTLKFLIHNDEMFTQYAKRIAEETKRAEKDNSFKKILLQIYDNMLEISEKQTEEADSQNFSIEKFFEKSAIEKAGLRCFSMSWTMIPATSRIQILRYIKTLVNNKVFVEFVGLVNHAAGKVVMTTLESVTLPFDTIQAIYRWWNGEISAYRCSKVMMDSFSTIVGGFVGGAAGAAFGAAIGPVGMVVGGVAGGMLGNSAAQFLSDRMTYWIFSIPKDVALEDAFLYFHLNVRSSNMEINTAYRQMCLKHHPDRGGKAEDFHNVQVNMAIIKAARGNIREL